MSKKLTEEYEQYMQESTPDLWSRIEEALPEKAAPVKTVKKKGFWQKYGKLMPVAAAAVLFIMILPVAYRLGYGATKDAEKVAEDAAPQMAENEMYSMTAEDTTEDSEEEKAVAEVNAAEADADAGSTVLKDMAGGLEEPAEDEEEKRAETTAAENDVQGSMESQKDGVAEELLEVEIERKDHSAYAEDGTVKVKCYFDLPVILSDTKAAGKINADLNRYYEETVAGMEEWRDDCLDSEYALFYFVETSVDYQANGIISFGFHQEVWGGGGVHSVNYSYTYDLNTGERLNLAEVLGVKDEALLEELALYRIEEDGQVRLWVGGIDDVSNVIIGQVNYGQ